MPEVREDRFVSPKGPGVRVLAKEEMVVLEDQRRAKTLVDDKPITQEVS